MTLAKRLYESPYESLYEFLRGNANTGVDNRNMRFPHK